MLSCCLPGTAYKEGKGPPHTSALGEGQVAHSCRGHMLSEGAGDKTEQETHRGAPSRRAHSLAHHTFNNPILRTPHPKGLWHRGGAHLHRAHTLLMCLQGRGLGGSQGLTLRISLEPKPESMRVSRSMSRMAQATSRCRLGPGSPVHRTWQCPRRGRSLAKPPPQAPPRSAPCPAHLPSTSPPTLQSICLSSPPQPSWRTSHSRRTSGKGNSLLNQMSSHRKQKQREPESWESGAGDSGGMGNAINPNPALIHRAPDVRTGL